MATQVLRVCTCGSGQLATGRCGRCVKPICGSCMVVAEGITYCSQQCADVAREYDRSARKDDIKIRRGGSGIVGTIFSLLCFAVIGYVVWWMFFNGPPPETLMRRFGF